MTDEDRLKSETLASAFGAGPTDFVTPVSSHEALGMFVIHALRDFSRSQHELSARVGTLSDQMIRWESSTTRIEELEKNLKVLIEEQQRRAGMQWLVEWVAKYIPWLIAVAAAVFALKIGYDPKS